MAKAFKTWFPILSGIALVLLNSCSNPGYYVVSFFLLIILGTAIYKKSGVFSPSVCYKKSTYIISCVIGLVLGILGLLRFISVWSNTALSRVLSSILPLSEKVCITILGSLLLLFSLPVLTILLLQLFQSVKKRFLASKYQISFLSILPYILFLIMMVGAILLKTNYNADEIYSYGLSNHNDGMGLSIIDGVTYTPASLPYDDYMMVSESSRFNYENVWLNQEMDVHPPLYYVLLHTICSFFPNTFSGWYAGIINIIFALLTLYVMRKWLLLISRNDEKVVLIISLIFALSAGVLSAITFFRMYIMSMFWNMLLIYLLSKELFFPTYDWPFYAKLYPVIVCGALTHYYCIVFAVLAVLVYGLVCLVNKQSKVVIPLIITGFSSGISTYALFPAMITHMFFSYRGTEAVDNLKGSFNDYINRLVQFFKMISQDLFGCCFLLFLLTITILLIYKLSRKALKISKTFLQLSAIVIIPCIIYFFFVSKSAAYISERYLVPVYPIVLSYVFYVLKKVLQSLVQKHHMLIFVSISAISLLLGWFTEAWPYLYRDSVQLIDFSKEHSDVDCIYIYEDEQTASLPFSFLETRNYRSVTFIGESNIDALPESVLQHNQLVVTIIPNKIKNLESIKEKLQDKNETKEIGTFLFSTTYHIY